MSEWLVVTTTRWCKIIGSKVNATNLLRGRKYVEEKLRRSIPAERRVMSRAAAAATLGNPSFTATQRRYAHSIMLGGSWTYHISTHVTRYPSLRFEADGPTQHYQRQILGRLVIGGIETQGAGGDHFNGRSDRELRTSPSLFDEKTMVILVPAGTGTK